MKVKYLINTEKVSNLVKWCKDNNQSLDSFKSALKRAKKAKKQTCTCNGYFIVKL